MIKQKLTLLFLVLFSTLSIMGCSQEKDFSKAENTQRVYQGQYSLNDQIKTLQANEIIFKLKSKQSGQLTLSKSVKSFSMKNAQPVINRKKILTGLRNNISTGKGTNTYGISGISGKNISDDALFDMAYKNMEPGEQQLLNIYKISTNNKLDAETKLKELQNSEDVEYAHFNNIYFSNYIPDDPYYGQQWSHKKTSAEEAWEITKGNSNITVAILDTGVDYNHEDLSANIWRDGNNNPGADFVDLSDSFISSIARHGFVLYNDEDYKDVDFDPSDYNGHGTHCAGIVAAVDNSVGIVGVAPGVKIMPLRAGFSVKDTNNNNREAGIFDDTAIINAIYHAANNGADVLSMSLGGGIFSKSQKEALDYAVSKNVTIVGAAGNNGSDSIGYPAGYDNVIAVAAIDSSGERAYYSQHGYWVDIAAPGSSILSTVPSRISSSGYKSLSGTSMACPYIAGVVALLKSKNSDYTNEEIKSLLKLGSTPFESTTYVAAGKVNILNSLEIDSIPDVTAEFISPENGSNSGDTPLVITGSATGDSYSLYHGEGKYPATWNKVAEGSSITNGTIATIENSTLFDGENKFKLVVKYNNYTYEDFLTIYSTRGIQPGWNEAIHKDLPIATTSPIVSDLNNDGSPEVIVVTEGRIINQNLLLIFNSDGSLLSSTYNDEYSGMMTPAIGNILGDEKKEIIIANYYGGIFVYSHEGELLLKKSNPDADVDCLFRTPVLANMDDDHYDEIVLIHGKMSIFTDPSPTKVSIYDGDLSVIKSFNLALSYVEKEPIVTDLDNDGRNDIVAVSRANDDSQSMIEAFSLDGKLWSYEVDQMVIASGLIAIDLDRNGTKEIIFSSWKNSSLSSCVHALDNKGNIFKSNENGGWPVKLNYPTTSIVPYDFDKDNFYELIVYNGYGDPSPNNNFLIIDRDGKTVKKINIAEASSWWEPAVGDIDGDGEIEFIFTEGYKSKKLYAYNMDGSFVEGFPKFLSNVLTPQNTPTLADLDKDGDLEILCGSYGLLVFDLPWQTSEDAIIWGTYRFDEKHNRNFDSISFNSNYNEVSLSGSWGTTPMTLVGDNTWKQNITSGSSSTEGFRFITSGEESLSFGDNNGDKIADLNGDLIALNPDKNYEITFNDSTLNYTLVEKPIGSTVQITYVISDNSGSESKLIGKKANLYKDNNIFDSLTIESDTTGRVKTYHSKLPVGEYRLDVNETIEDYTYVGSISFTITEDGQTIEKTMSVDRKQIGNYKSIYSQVYFRGTANNWESTKMNLVADYTWQIKATFGNGANERFKFDIHGDWSLNFGDSNGDQTADESGDDIKVSGGKEYTIIFNDKTKSYSITSESGEDFTSVYSQVYLRGTFNNWESTPMVLVANNKWELRIIAGSSTNERFKFDIHGDWSLNFGDNNGDHLADQSGDDISLSSGKTYVVTFNDGTKQYSLKEDSNGGFASIYSNVYVRGTFNNWKSTPMTLVANNRWEANITSGSSGVERFKFDIYEDWSLNFGDNNSDGICEQGGKDIPLQNGKSYQVRFNDITRVYELTEKIIY